MAATKIKRKAQVAKVFGNAKGIVSFGWSGIPKAAKIDIGKVRNKLGLTQFELSRVTGYSPRSIASWESGKVLSDSAKQKLIETERLRVAFEQVGEEPLTVAREECLGASDNICCRR